MKKRLAACVPPRIEALKIDKRSILAVVDFIRQYRAGSFNNPQSQFLKLYFLVF